MRFLNLNTLKIEKVNIIKNTFSWDFRVDCNITLNDLKSLVKQVIESAGVIPSNADANVNSNPTQFAFKINIIDDKNNPLEASELEDFIETVVNVVNLIIFNGIVDLKGRGRPRERRLDVPTNLKEEVYASLTLLKKAINTRTYYDVFNIFVDFSFTKDGKTETIAYYNLVEQDI